MMMQNKLQNQSANSARVAKPAALVAIHQLHYLPWLRYFDKILRADAFIVLDNIQYNKNGWQNRNKIQSASGPLLLSVPVLHCFQQRLDQVRINNQVSWQKKHWASIQQCYRKAPFFADHAGFLAEVYSREWRFLNELNRHMLTYFVQALGIDTPLLYSSELHVPGDATERLIHLIQAARGNRYYSGAYALDAYLDADLLKAAHIDLVLQQWTAPRYPQCYSPFIADLSILDLLMNCGPRSKALLLGEPVS